MDFLSTLFFRRIQPRQILSNSKKQHLLVWSTKTAKLGAQDMHTTIFTAAARAAVQL
jgi:hypothetical protein